MLHWILALALALPLDTPPPDKAAVDTAVAALDRAFKDGETGDRLRALEGAAGLASPEVVARVAKALRDKDSSVAVAAANTLRFIAHADAQKALEARAKQPDARKDALLFAALLKGLGQHRAKSSIEVLGDDPWSVQDAKVLEARILGLGRIRDVASVEKLFDLMKVAGRHNIQPHMQHFRTALVVLTGADQGASQDLWLRWWNENKSKLRVSATEGELPKLMQIGWDAYWADPRESEQRKDERKTKRDERGGKDDAGRGREKRQEP